MTLLQLRYFLALSEHLHYTKSAEQLHISQPSLSYAISELESELGVELFIRRNRKIFLSENGTVFLRYVKNAISVLDEGTRTLQVLNGMREDRVRLGYFYSLSSPYIPRLVSSFYAEQQTSHVMLDFLQEQDAALLDLLQSGDLDLAFCLSMRQGIESVPVLRQRMNLVVPKSHPLSERAAVRFEDFCAEPLVLLSNRSQARHMVEQIYQRHGKIPQLAVEAVECNATLQFVALGRGVSIIPAIPALELSPVRSLPIEGDEFSRTVYLSWSEGHPMSHGAQLLKSYILEHCHDLEELAEEPPPANKEETQP